MSYHFIDALNDCFVANANNDTFAFYDAANRKLDDDFYDCDYVSLQDYMTSESLTIETIQQVDDCLEVMMMSNHEDAIKSDYVATRLRNMTVADIDKFVADSRTYTSQRERYDLRTYFLAAKALLMHS